MKRGVSSRRFTPPSPKDSIQEICRKQELCSTSYPSRVITMGTHLLASLKQKAPAPFLTRGLERVHMSTLRVVFLLASTIVGNAQGSKWTINFEPESERFAQATKDYQSLWTSEGKRIVETMESWSGLKFDGRDVRAIVFEGVSSSGFGDTPMKLRASYPPEVKKGTLIHE